MPQSQVRWTAYGAQAQGELREVITEAKRTDPLAPLTVVVPSDLAGVLTRRFLASGVTEGSPPRRGIAGLQILTVDRLAEQLATAALVGTGRRPATNPVLAAAWRRTLAADSGIFAHVAAHPTTVQALVDAHRTLRDLSAPGIDAVAASGPLTKDLVRLHRQVVGLLAGSWFDVADLRAGAVRAIADRPETARALGTIVTFLPQDLAQSQAALLRQVAAATDLVLIAGLTGDRRADAAVKRSIARIGLLADGAPDLPVAVATGISHAADADDEVRAVVRDLIELLHTRPAHKVAVLYGSSTPYARLLHEQLAAAGVCVNGTGERPTVERVMARALVDLLALAQDGLDRSAVLRLLTSAPIRGADGKRVPSSRWERLSRAALVVGEDSWGPRLRRYADSQRGRAATGPDGAAPPDWLVAKCNRTADDADTLRAFIEDLQERLAAGRSTNEWTELALWALDSYHALLGDETTRWQLPPEEARAARRVEQLLQGLMGLEAIEPEAGLGALRDVVELELGDDLPRVGVFGTGVLVAHVQAAVGLDVDQVFVVGLAEGAYPDRVYEDALLPDHAREVTGGELPAARERFDRQRRYLLAALAAAPRAVASFPRGDLRRSTQRLPSRWLLPSLRSLSGQPSLAATAWEACSGSWLAGSPSFAATVTRTPVPSNQQEWRLRALAAGRDRGRRADAVLPDDLVVQGALALIQGREGDAFSRFDGNLTQHAAQLPDPADGKTPYSPTKLEAWAKCPHGYYLNRVLGVWAIDQPEDVLSIRPADLGTLTHEVLDRFFARLQVDDTVPGPDTEWTDDQRRLLRRCALSAAEEAERDGLTGHPTLWQPQLRQLLQSLDLFLTQDSVRRHHGKLRQVRSELKLTVDVPLPDGRRVRMHGTADRIDRAADGSVVVADYKSGSAYAFKVLSETNPDANGTKLQLPVYAYGARRELDLPDAPVRAEYWFIGSKDRGRRIGFDLTPEVEQRYAAVLATIADGIAGGVFPGRPEADAPWKKYVDCYACNPDGISAGDRLAQWDRTKHDGLLAEYVGLVEAST